MSPRPSLAWGLALALAFVLSVPPAAHAWTPIGPWGGMINDLRGVAGGSDTLFAGTGNGAYAWSGAGPWVPFQNTLGYRVVRLAPDLDNSVLYALAGPSTDPVPDDHSYPRSGDLFRLDATSYSGSFASMISTQASSLTVCGSGDLLAAVEENGQGFIYRFPGGAGPYQMIQPHGFFDFPIYALLASSGSSTVYFVQNSSTTGRIWKSGDCGVTWAQEAYTESTIGTNFISLGYGRNGEILAGTADKDVWVRDPALQTWSRHPGLGLPSTSGHEYPVSDFGTGPNGEVFAVVRNHEWWATNGDPSGLFQMPAAPSDPWIRWGEFDVVSSEVAAAAPLGGDLLVGFQRAGIYRVPSGDRQSFKGDPADEGIRSVSLEGLKVHPGSGRCLAFGISGVYIREAQDGSWRRLLFGAVTDPAGNPVSPDELQFIREGRGFFAGDFSPDDPDLIWVGGQAGLLRGNLSPTGADTWTHVFTDTTGRGRVWVVTADPFDPDRAWWGTPGGIYYTGDGGATFTELELSAAFNVRDIRCEYLEPGTRRFLAGWEADSNCRGLLASDDDGRTWYEALFIGEGVTSVAFNPQKQGGSQPAAVLGFNWENLQSPVPVGLAVLNNNGAWLPDTAVGLPSGLPDSPRALALDIPVGEDGDNRPDAFAVFWGNPDRGAYWSSAGEAHGSPGEAWTRIGGIDQYSPTFVAVDPKDGNRLWAATLEASLFTLTGSHFQDNQGPSWDPGAQIEGVGSTATKVFLRWPAPGDDNQDFGWADRYELRYGPVTFGQADSFSTWGNPVPSVPSPRLARREEIVPVDYSGLGAGGGSLAFALKAFDEQNQPSPVLISGLHRPVDRVPLSNVGQTVTPGQVAFTWDTPSQAEDPYFQYGGIVIQRNGSERARLGPASLGWSDSISMYPAGSQIVYTLWAMDGAGNGSPVTRTVTVPDASGGGGGGGGGGCFIATAAYGTAMEPEVDLLRSYRDRYLRNRAWGRALVRVYEITSPPVADLISRRAWLRSLTRLALSPVVAAVIGVEQAGGPQVLPVLTGLLVLAILLVPASTVLFLARRAIRVARSRNIEPREAY